MPNQNIPIKPERLRVLVTDDTALYRRTISDILKGLPDVEVIGAAFDGEDCLELAQKLLPDLITLDIQMPRRDGLSTLEELKKRGIASEVVMVCSQTTESADQTLKALRMGALDMILKPSGSSLSENQKFLESQLIRQIQTVHFRKTKRTNLQATSNRFPEPTNRSKSSLAQATLSSPTAISRETTVARSVAGQDRVRSHGIPKCVCIGISTGGPQALSTVVQSLSVNMSVPIFVVQHMPPIFTKSLANHLSSNARIPVTEAVDGEMAERGHMYIAPGGKQMRVVRKVAGLQIQITDDPAIGACKPSVDYLFDSINECVGRDTIAIVMTGMGSDGLEGCKKLYASGARIITQNAETCVVYGMPKQVADRGLSHEVLALDMIGSRITQLTR
jgi:two-component system, chemotaxis family, protein-glutamate methylesterase/glutaminase